VGFFRLFRSGEPRTLLDRQHAVNLDGDREMRLLPDDVFLRFAGFVLHFKIEGDRLRRVEPIALSPALFVDEWEASPWAEVAQWSEPSLASWHARLHQDLVLFGFWDNVGPCSGRPAKWQIVAEIDRQPLYFLVEEKDPSSYRMLDVSTAPQPGCAP
jgi:hypothetical protein